MLDIPRAKRVNPHIRDIYYKPQIILFSSPSTKSPSLGCSTFPPPRIMSLIVRVDTCCKDINFIGFCYFYIFVLLTPNPVEDTSSIEMYNNGKQELPKSCVKFQQNDCLKKPRKVDQHLRSKTNCHMHNQKLRFKCEEKQCKQPFMCLHPDCIDEHFHTPILQVTKIDLAFFEEKFEKTLVAIGNSENLFGRAIQIKAIIDSLKSSVGQLFKDMGSMTKIFNDLRGQVDSVLTSAFIGKIDEALRIESKIMSTIENIKSKISLNPVENQDSFILKSEIRQFLQGNINNFQWKTASTIINIREKMYDATQFHAALAGKTNLIFIVITEGFVVGSYFSCPYPSYSSGMANDPKSFIFITRQDSNKVLKYLANSDSSHHLQVSQQYFISHGRITKENEGIRLSSDNIDTLEIELPTQSFVAEDVQQQSIVERVQVQQLLVIQVAETVIE